MVFTIVQTLLSLIWVKCIPIHEHALWYTYGLGSCPNWLGFIPQWWQKLLSYVCPKYLTSQIIVSIVGLFSRREDSE